MSGTWLAESIAPGAAKASPTSGRHLFATGSRPLWRIMLTASPAATAAFEQALAECCDTVSGSFDAEGGCHLEALSAAEPDWRALDLALAIAAAVAGVPPPAVCVAPLPERDWLAENRERFAPFRIGRFHIQEPDDATPLPAGPIALRIEAASAFGSGRHGSTEGCLRALDRLAARPVRRPLDVGCGSGILAIAAAKLWRVPVLASDADPAAVAVARANARLNGVGRLVHTIGAAGYRAPAITARRPFDLVSCNILTRPLKRLAADLARQLAPGGVAVLGGFLAADGNDVAAVHRAAGLHLVFRLDVDGWRTLVVGRPATAATSGAR